MSRVYAYKYPGSEVFFCRRADPATSSRDAPRVLADAVERLGRIAAPLALEVKVAAYPDTF